ncbi:MAG: hypothetical protein NXI28_12445 [bacterium]|nr:hypothetical protein [bacterium]|tara:strand:- start:22 stop:708 length:687 start_codon:yes stop_codon:yes gene_type:complete
MSRPNKQQRRRTRKQKEARRKRTQIDQWTKFEPVVEIPPQGDDPGGTMYQNSKYCVAVRKADGVIRLAITNLDHSAKHDWRDFQRIKNELIGPDAEAVELYPSEDRLIDTTNTFHLWSPIDHRFDFGFEKGRHVESSDESGLPQRAPLCGERFKPGQRVWVKLSQLSSDDAEFVITATVASTTESHCVCVDDSGHKFNASATCVFESYEALKTAIRPAVECDLREDNP